MQMNTEENIRSIYVLIVVGILLAIGCTLVALFNPVSKPVNILNIIFIIVQAGIGLATIIISRKFTKKFFHLFMGLLYLSWSLIYLFAYTLFSYSLKEMWPLLGISAGILWFIAGRLKYQTLDLAVSWITLIHLIKFVDPTVSFALKFTLVNHSQRNLMYIL